MAVLQFQIVTILVHQLRLVPSCRNSLGLTVQINALVVPLEEHQVGDPLNVIAVGNALITKSMGIVPSFGNELFVGC
ncbi:hypothetical protein D3C80_1909230 [compost metagenome]